MKTDPRVSVTFDEDELHATFCLIKTKMSDEAKFKCTVEDEDGKQLDFAGFSLFVKG